MKDTDKITLTIGQLKKLVRESYDDEYDRDYNDEQSFVWRISKAYRDEKSGKFYEDDEIATSKRSWEYSDPAIKNAKLALSKMKPGFYYFVVYDENNEAMDEYIDAYMQVTQSGRVKFA